MRSYQFGRFRLDGDTRVLFRDDTRIALAPKAVDVLLMLVESGGAPVGRQELFQKIWSDALVEDGTLSSHISLLRKTVGPQFIETIPKRGYRFAGEVVAREADRRVLLAVLPFENLSGSRKYDAFSDGLTEEMITQLGKLHPARLGVIARTSSMTYKSTDKTVEQIGRELGVSHVLEGSVRRSGDRVRIAAQLIQVSDQTHVWAESYEGNLKDILSLQSGVSRDVAKQVQIRLLPQKNPKQVIPDAYQAYVKGRYLWDRRTESDLRLSIRCFKDAIRSDERYAAAYSGMADSYLTLQDGGYISLREASAKARPLIARALELDESLADAHVSAGHIALHHFDWASAEREFDRAISLNPSSASAHFYYSNYLTAMCRMPEALRAAEEARRLDPMSPAAYANLASLLWHAGDYERAIAESQKSLDLSPDHARSYEHIGRAYEQMGDFDAAIEAFQKTPQASDTLASLGHTYAVAGKRKKALRILRELEHAAKTTFVPAYNIAVIYAGLQNDYKAFLWLDKAFEERSGALPFLRTNPRLGRLRDDPRFRKLLERIGLR